MGEKIIAIPTALVMCPWTRAPPAKTARWEATATSSGKTHNPDNLRSAVSRAHRYEPDTNPTYHDLARHYGVAVLPARVRRPRDKSLVS